VTGRARVSRRTFYDLFENREECLLEALESVVEQVRGELAAAGLDGLWIGEMATFDAFALATAIGARVPGLGLRVGPLPVSVRTPVSIALGASSVAALTGCEIDVALGASSPFIVAGWHDRDWSHSAARMRETIECLRPILRGERGDEMRVGVTQRVDGDAGGEIQIALAVGRHEPNAFAPLEGEVDTRESGHQMRCHGFHVRERCTVTICTAKTKCAASPGGTEHHSISARLTVNTG